MQARASGTRKRPLIDRIAAQMPAATFEIALFALLVLTVAAITWQDFWLTRSTVLTPESVAARAKPHSDSNEVNHGTSSTTLLGPMHWRCEIRKGFGYPYCGYEMELAAPGTTRGLNLKNFRSMSITLAYQGSGKTFRVYLKNFDPRYSDAADPSSPKFNRIEIAVTPGREQTFTNQLADFGVAEWWVLTRKTPPALSHPQFDNIIAIDIQTGTDIAEGRHEFRVKEIVLRTAIMSDAQWYLLLLAIWIGLIGLNLAWRLRILKREIRRRRRFEALALQQAQDAEEEARQDHLTKLLNRRGVTDRFAALATLSEPVEGIGVILIDIDHFKAINDTFGHSYGDDVLSTVATLIRRYVRAGDIVGRWGGEEYLVLCPAVDAEEASAAAEKLRRRIENFHFGDCEHVTASFGVHWSPAMDPGLHELVRLADIALYAAKRDGRNRCDIYRPGMAKAA